MLIENTNMQTSFRQEKNSGINSHYYMDLTEEIYT